MPGHVSLASFGNIAAGIFPTRLVAPTPGELTMPHITNVSVLYEPTLTAFGIGEIMMPHIANANTLYAPILGELSLQTLTMPHLANANVLYEPEIAGEAPADWVEGWHGTGGQDAISGFDNKNFRVLLPASSLQNAYGDKIRLTFKAGGDALVIDDCFIGKKAASGDPWDFDGTPTRVTFNTGDDDSGSISSHATKLSDEIDFTFEEETDYVVSFYTSSGDAPWFYFPADQDGVVGWYKGGANDAATEDASGYTVSEVHLAVMSLAKLEVFGFNDGDPDVPAVPLDPFGDGVIFMFTADGGDREADAALAPFGDYDIPFADLITTTDSGDDVLSNSGTLQRAYAQWDSSHDDTFAVQGEDFTLDGYHTFKTNTPTFELFSFHGNEAFFIRRSIKLIVDGGFLKLALTGPDSGDVLLTSGVQIVADQRTHIEASRGGNHIYLFQDGVLVDDAAWTGPLNYPSSVDSRLALNVPEQFGLLDDWRFTKGFCRHTADFTPRTHALRPGATPHSPDAHSWWEILVTDNNGSAFTSIGSKLTMYNSTDASGDNLVATVGGIISGSHGGVFGNVLANLLDANDSTQWAASETGAEWVRFHFPVPVDVNSIKLKTVSGQEGLMLKDFALRWSDDGTTWTAEFSKTGEDWTTGAAERTYTA